MPSKILGLLATTTFAALLNATPAAALSAVDETVVVDYSFQGDHLTSGWHGVDFVGGGFDRSGTDLSEDLWFNAGADTLSLNFTSFYDDFGPASFQRGGFAVDASGVAQTFTAGDTVQSGAGYSFGPSTIDLTTLLDTGETGIYGFAFDFFTVEYIGSSQNGEADWLCTEVPDSTDCAQDVFATYYGWVEVTKGSIIPGTLAYNPSGAGATVFGNTPAVPLPAAGWLMVAGLGGLAALRRRAA